MPSVWPAMEKHWGLKYRRGEVGMIFAAPGVGKSVLSLNIAIAMQVPCIYISPDTSQSDTYNRAAAILSGDTMQEIENNVANGRSHYYDSLLDRLEWLRFTFDGPVTFGELKLEVDAYEEVYGETPQLIVVDNLRDIDTEGEGEGWERHGIVLEYLKTMARATGALILVLHHTVASANDGVKNGGQASVEGQATKPLSFALSLAVGESAGQKTLKVSAVKNRSGKNDPSGSTYYELYFDSERARIK